MLVGRIRGCATFGAIRRVLPRQVGVHSVQTGWFFLCIAQERRGTRQNHVPAAMSARPSSPSAEPPPAEGPRSRPSLACARGCRGWTLRRRPWRTARSPAPSRSDRRPFVSTPAPVWGVQSGRRRTISSVQIARMTYNLDAGGGSKRARSPFFTASGSKVLGQIYVVNLVVYHAGEGGKKIKGRDCFSRSCGV